jgi:class 3 adenylate cyclase/CheY-like chemotaxis protein
MNPNAGLADYLNLSSRMSTFVSVDVIDSTQLKYGENEQDVIYTFLSYHKLIKQCAYEHHGEVITISGDGMMCRFEYPDDAAAAVQVILKDLPGFNRRQNRLVRPLALRLGVHTGEVYENQSLTSGNIISQTVDLAAKLQQMAPPDRALFSQNTIDLLKQTKLPVQRLGWDSKLRFNVYQYGGSQAVAAERKLLPSPVRVLLVEEDLEEIIKLKRILSARHHESFCVYNQNQATLCVSSWQPHVILLSGDLSWDSGWEFLSGLRSDPSASGIPVIFMSQASTDKTIQKCLGMGANGFLAKPLEELQVVKRVEMVLREFYQ